MKGISRTIGAGASPPGTRRVGLRRVQGSGCGFPVQSVGLGVLGLGLACFMGCFISCKAFLGFTSA